MTAGNSGQGFFSQGKSTFDLLIIKVRSKNERLIEPKGNPYENTNSARLHCAGPAFNPQLSTLNCFRPRHGVHVSRPVERRRESRRGNIRFTIYDALTLGTQQGYLITNATTVVSNGLFTVTLDFGSQFPGAGRWLEIAVRTNGAAVFIPLAPRQKLTPTPYAITASNLSGTLPAVQLSGQLAGSQIANGAVGAAQVDNTAVQVRVTGAAPAGQFITSINANGSVNIAADTSDWKLAGNNVTPGQFLGSTNNQALEIRVNGLRSLQILPTASDATHSNIVNQVGGSPVNFIPPGVYGSVISGGGAAYYADGAYPNSVAADMSVLGGGGGNFIQTNALYSFLGGGINNSIGTNSATSFLGGGYNNTIRPNAPHSFIGSGTFNVIESFGGDSVIVAGYGNHIRFGANGSAIVGGSANEIQTNVWVSFIGGGERNSVGYGVQDAAIGGGSNNIINGMVGFIGGGQSNTVVYPFTHDTIGGGLNNTAGGYYAVIGGGRANQTAEQGAAVGGGEDNLASGWGSFIGGGDNNQATATGSVIGGGGVNKASGPDSTVGGGEQNQATGTYATIPGGYLNSATGTNSFAAGQQARALHNGAFVWADSQNSAFLSTAANQFVVRAAGGVGINTNNPGATLDVNGSLRVGNGTTIFNNLQAGVAQQATDSATVKTNFTFTFPKAFISVPNVLVSARNATAGVDDTFAVTVRTVTTTTCTVNVVRTDAAAGWGQHVLVTWMAWE
jgi:hypothetical protein